MRRYVLVFDMDQTLWHGVKVEQQGKISIEKYGNKPSLLESSPHFQKMLTKDQFHWMEEATFEAWMAGSDGPSGGITDSYSVAQSWNTSIGLAPAGLVWTLAVEPMRCLVNALNAAIDDVTAGNIKLMIITHGSWHPSAIRCFFRERYGATESLTACLSIFNKEMINQQVDGINISSNKSEVIRQALQLATIDVSETRRVCGFKRSVTVERPMYKPRDVYFFEDEEIWLEQAASLGYNSINSRRPEFAATIYWLADQIKMLKEWFFLSSRDI
ncbi:hypothetical protein ACWJJH_05710 [Endozoicomonadaceae bacterium StTr2]